MLYRKVLTKTVVAPYFGSHFRFISCLNLWHEELTSEIKLKIEEHWKDKIKFEKFNENDASKEKYYLLSMFPYPSGSLHMGHVRVYTISDVIARFQRMNGKNVIHPIGWDAFGLPAENAAIERRIPPSEWTQKNISHMKSQLQRLGCSFEWEREVATCDPSYYKWTQDLFLKLFDAGLIYQKEAMVNWDPVDQTVLAHEQVDENGCSWRSGAKVEKKPLKQWFVRTTKFAKDLLEGLDDGVLHDWRDIIKLQRHWIGDCDGVNFEFKITGSNKEFLTVWTSKPEYIKHSKFVVLSSSHVLSRLDGQYLTEGTKKLNLELINPFTKDIIPVYTTSEVEFLPQTDLFLGIPGACEQSAIFANRFNIPFDSFPLDIQIDDLNCVQKQICDEARELGVGGHWSSAKLRDWLISRQRFWGTPIPIIHCKTCGAVPARQLPVELPKEVKQGEKLEEISSWVNCKCPNCNGDAKRETDTMDTFVDSSWYYLRYLDPHNSQEMFSKSKVMKLMPVDLYIGGKEHAVLHLYYARFISHFLHYLGLIPEREPFKRLLVQGMVMGRSYRVKGTGRYVQPKEVKVTDNKTNKAVLETTGEPVVMAWEKMSKSKHNGVDPQEMFEKYSCDTTRLLILADVAPTSHRNWNSNTFPGILNWQKRLWLTMRDFIKHRSTPPPQIDENEFRTHDDYMFDSRNYYIKGATFNFCGSQQHSVAISKQQGLTNSLRRMPAAVFANSLQFERALAAQIILLAPIAPHFASELWSGFVSAPNRLNNSGEIDWNKQVLEQKWPTIDPNYNLELVCQVNGDELCVVKMSKTDLENLSQDEAIKIAFSQEKMQDELSDRTIVNTVYTVHKDYEVVVNVKTKYVPKEKSASQ